MPLEDAILLVSRNFDTYMQALRDRELRPPLAADTHAPKKGYPGAPGAVSSVVPSPYTREVSTLLNIAADGRPLTVDEYTLVIDEFTKLRNDLLKKEGRVPPSSTGIVQYIKLYLLVNPALKHSRPSHSTLLLTTLNNVGSTTLFKAVFINPEQIVRFYACSIVSKCVSGKTAYHQLDQ